MDPITDYAVVLLTQGLRPDDLDVDVVFGVADPTGDLQVVSDAGATLEDTAEDGICRFVAKFPPSVAGRAGYAVRVLPGHPQRLGGDLGRDHPRVRPRQRGRDRDARRTPPRAPGRSARPTPR